MIRDCGIDVVGAIFPLEPKDGRHDRVEITVPGPDYLDRIEAMAGVEIEIRTGNEMVFRANGWELEDPTSTNTTAITIPGHGTSANRSCSGPW